MKRTGRILLVEDEDYVRDSLSALLAKRGFEVQCATRADEVAGREDLDGVDVVVTDLRMPGEDGLSLLRRLVADHPGLAVIVLTGHGSVLSAVECMRAGAFEYLQKPVDPDALVLLLQRALRESGLRRELDYLRSGGEGPGEGKLLGASDPWRRVLDVARIAAPSDTTVLILGESGTGKEEVARFLHRESERADGPFVCVNCAAVPVELFESEFFGHRRGAFTGAVEDRVGRLKVAHAGTLFLDEINSLPMLAQAKVLRVLQDGTFERVGDSRPTSVDVRLICATNVELEAEVEAGRFRQDLFYRINVMSLRLPPLRERPEDIPLLATAFLAEFSGKLGKHVGAIAPEVLASFAQYDWPGNVRELRNVIERGVLLERTARLTTASVPEDLRRPARAADRSADLNLRASLKAEEKRLIAKALARAGGVRREAARLLGIDERNLSYYLRKHGLS